MNLLEQLTNNFALSEFTYSPTAKKYGMGNYPRVIAIKALINLCNMVLQPLRNHYGHPIMVLSGYRTRSLNKALGERKDSQHLRGEAADILFPDAETAEDWIEFVRCHCMFDEMVLRPSDNELGRACLHISCCTDPARNRRVFRTEGETPSDNLLP